MWKVIAEECRRAEVNALEWKLRETRRRHIDELARLGGPKGQVWTSDRASPSEMSPAFRGGGAGHMLNGMHETAGPVLVSCRRDCGAHRIRLWVEDLASIGSARVHAIDEATGARIYKDIPDAALSRLLTIFRRSPTCDPDDVDDFLRAMLRACKIRMFPGGLDIVLPSEQDLQPEIRPAPLNLRVMQHISAMGNQRLVGQVGQVSFGNPKAASAKSIPCMAVAPGHSGSGSVTGITPVTSLNQTQQRPPRPSKPPGRPQPGTPRRPVRRARPQSAPHTGRVEEPKTSKAMEAAFEADAANVANVANVACGCPKASNVVAPTPCNPCEACEAKSYHGHTVPSVMPGVAGAFRGRRARPTSAKALKHRRVVDDSVDSIIYEDDEEEQEDQEEVAQVVTEAASQGSLTSGQDTRYGDTGEPLGETISESFETTCDSVDSVDCASKLSEVHVRDVEPLTMQDIGIHRPTTPMCSMVSMTPVRGAPQLCLNLSPSTSSSNAQGQLGQIGQADPDREMREFPEVKMQEPGGTYGEVDGPALRNQDGCDAASEGTGIMHVLIKDLHLEDFTALGALEPRSSSPPPRPEMSNVS